MSNSHAPERCAPPRLTIEKTRPPCRVISSASACIFSQKFSKVVFFHCCGVFSQALMFFKKTFSVKRCISYVLYPMDTLCIPYFT